jgi:hypothetical protein
MCVGITRVGRGTASAVRMADEEGILMRRLIPSIALFVCACGTPRIDEYLEVCERIAARQRAEDCFSVIRCSDDEYKQICDELIENLECIYENTSCTDGVDDVNVFDVCGYYVCWEGYCQCGEDGR